MGNQWAIAFTLLLTVVAFNLYVAEHIPQLPYTIFVELFITFGYLLIFAEIIAVLIQHMMIRKGHEETARNFINICRWLFPLGYFSSLIILNIIFLEPKLANSFSTTRENLVAKEFLVRNSPS